MGHAPCYGLNKFGDSCALTTVKEPVSQISTANDGMVAEGIYSATGALENGGVW